MSEDANAEKKVTKTTSTTHEIKPWSHTRFMHAFFDVTVEERDDDDGEVVKKTVREMHSTVSLNANLGPGQAHSVEIKPSSVLSVEEFDAFKKLHMKLHLAAVAKLSEG